MTEPLEPAEDAALQTIIETASFDDGTEATDDEPVAESPIPGAKTP